MNINNTKYRLPNTKIFTDIIPKDLILLHFTAGSSVEGAWTSWMTQTINIGTPYIVDVDGTIYEIFDPKYWAYHLGVTGPFANNHQHDKRSVPIETVNVGPLKLVGNNLNWWPANYGQKYCSLDETDKYVKVTYRGFDYYPVFPQVQLQAIKDLVHKISIDFNIPLKLSPPENRMLFDLNFFSKWKGIAAHHNFRPDKFDIGPVFDWDIV